MFSNRKKVEEDIRLPTLRDIEPIVAPTPTEPKKELTLEELESLYLSKSISKSLDLNKYLPLSDDDQAALKVIEALESIGCDPIELNLNWYLYTLPINFSGFSALIGDNNLSTHIYSFPIPLRVMLKIKELDSKTWNLKRDGNGRPVGPNFRTRSPIVSTFVTSLSSTLGILPENITKANQSPIPSDPLLLVKVEFKGKSFCYNLGSWDLTLDLNSETKNG